MRPDTFTCACKATFTIDSSGYANHIGKCSKYRAEQASSSNKLLEALRRQKQRKAEMRERRRHESPSQLQDTPPVQAEPTFVDEIPNTAALRGLQSARTGQDAAASEAEGSRPRRTAIARRLPARFRHLLPEARSVLVPREASDGSREGDTVEVAQDNTTAAGADDSTTGNNAAQSKSIFQTLKNIFGVFRTYNKKPSRIPDQDSALTELTDGLHRESSHPPSTVQVPDDRRPSQASASDDNHAQDLARAIHPFPNVSTFRLAHWYHNSGASGSRESLSKLVNDVLRSSDFELGHLDKQNMEKLDRSLDRMDQQESRGESEVGDVAQGSSWDGWKEECVRIQVPTGVKSNQRPAREDASRTFDVNGLYRRQLVDIIRSTFESQAAGDFHYDPFTTHWDMPSWMPTLDSSGDNPATSRVHDELYTSEAWIEEQAKIDQLPDIPDDLPRAIAGMMFWSDATHLTQFGSAKMWPLYLYFGNQSKLLRGRPTARASHHVAYIPSLPDSFQDFVRTLNRGKSGSADLLQHCKRELFHAVWLLMMDSEFLHTYRHGIVVRCGDGITRRLFPRIFTYSADYPEKVLVATIRNLGNCPCPLCLVHRDHIHLLGTAQDKQTRSEHPRTDDEDRQRRIQLARDIIYEQGYAPGNQHGEHFLKKDSSVATKNAFSVQLSHNFQFNYFIMLVVDLLHEFELGVWKAVFIHLVRLLYTLGQTVVDRFNERFRKIGNFGRATIRSFAYMNVTDMKNWAARTYEDCLQCCFACLEGLLPEPENTAVLRFIYILCLWHGLAKCRQHTDVTLKLLEVVTERLGDELRAFESYTATFDTYETPKEASARDRRAAASARKGKLASRGSNNDKSGRRKKRFSLRTVKVHLLGHYVPTIQRFGTTDSYSTQVGELEHRTVKGFYRRTNKQDFVKQTTRLCRRQERIQKITENVRKLGIDVGKKMKIIDRSKSIPLPPTQPALQYQIAETSKHWIHLGHLVRENPDEPALRSFITNLKNHVIGRLRNRPFDGEEMDFGAEECDNLVIKDNIIHQHAYLRINYTTYDVRRDQDIINPRIPSRSFVMVPAAAGDHPYWYARVLGIYDLSVSPSRQDPAPVKLQFLWVRWLGEDPNHIGDFDSASLYRVGYVRFSSGSEAFGFLDPSIVIRGCHLIPAFRFGFTKDLLPASDFYDDPEAGDFVNYYVNQFVDRDMLMRFIGCGVGHAGMVDATYAPGAVQQILNIASTSKTDETLEAIRLLPEGRRQLAGDEEVLLESDGDEGGSNSEAAGSDRDSEMDVDDDDGDAASLEDYEY